MLVFCPVSGRLKSGLGLQVWEGGREGGRAKASPPSSPPGLGIGHPRQRGCGVSAASVRSWAAWLRVRLPCTGGAPLRWLLVSAGREEAPRSPLL